MVFHPLVSGGPKFWRDDSVVTAVVLRELVKTRFCAALAQLKEMYGLPECNITARLQKSPEPGLAHRFLACEEGLETGHFRSSPDIFY